MKPQWKRLVEYLNGYPEGRTIKQCRDDLWVQNIQDAAMQARRNGHNIETAYRHQNKKIASYRIPSCISRAVVPKINLLPQVSLFDLTEMQ